MSKSTHFKYTKSQVKSLKSHWQKTGVNSLASLFIAFDEKSQESRRVVAYNLAKSAFTKISKLEQIKYFVVHFGASEHQSSKLMDIPNYPFFVPILEVVVTDKKSEFYSLQWNPDPTYLKDAWSVNSRIDAIPGAGAYLFILSWLEKGFNQLHEAFEGICLGMNRRVSKYIFDSKESNMILRQIRNKNRNTLNLYLGSSMRVSAHPFPIRPIIEVSSEGDALVDSGSSFFDFCNPCPPYCDE